MKISVFVSFLCAIHAVVADVPTPHQCLLPPSQKCFTVIVDQRLNWNNAEKYCERNLPNGRLASIHNAFEGAVIFGWLPFLSTDPWIGGIQLGSQPYQWVDGSAFDYTNWTPGEPTESCVQVCHSTATNAGVLCQQGKWRTADCETNVSQIICEYGNYSSSPPTSTTAPSSPPTGSQLIPTANVESCYYFNVRTYLPYKSHFPRKRGPSFSKIPVVLHYCNSDNSKCFSLVTGMLEWSEAEKFCKSQKENNTEATLASITSEEDAHVVATFLQYPNLNSNVWIGAFVFGGPPFEWADKSTFSFTNWAPGQPDTSADGCVQVCLRNDTNCVQGKWTVVPCKTAQSFVCENLIYKAADCLDLHQKYSHLPSGTYILAPPGVAAFNAYCDMETDGGGWTVFHRRVDSTFSFYNKTWIEYKYGFNNGLNNNNLWLGNDNIHILSTKDSNVELRIDIWGDRAPNSPYPNGYWSGHYATFSIDSEANYYAIHIPGIATGNATSGRDFRYSDGRRFSTLDSGDTMCIVTYQLGGWWFAQQYCSYTSLNGNWVPLQWHNYYGYVWWSDGNGYMNPVRTRMMLRKTA